MMVAVGPSSFFIASRFWRRRRECNKGEGRRRRLGTSLINIDLAVLLLPPPVDVMGESDSTSESLVDLDLAASEDLALEAAVAEAEVECWATLRRMCHCMDAAALWRFVVLH
jgi:hypothetical protein